MLKEHQILTELVALTDALFLVWREVDSPAAAEVAFRRSRFATAGIIWTASNDAAAQDLAKLNAAGMVIIFSANGRRFDVRLTPAGEAIAREIAAPFQLDRSSIVLWRAMKTPALSYGGWVGEIALAEMPDWPGEDHKGRGLLNVVQELALPLLSGLYAESTVGESGRAFYRAIGDEPPPVHVIPSTLRPDINARALYARIRNGGRKALSSLQSSRPAPERLPIKAAMHFVKRQSGVCHAG